MNTTNENAAAVERYHEIAEVLSLRDGDVVQGKMFGMECIKVNGKAFAGLHHGEMVFKLTGEAHKKALGLPGAALFDPAHMGRPMKEWVQVPFEQSEIWEELAESALGYVGKR